MINEKQQKQRMDHMYEKAMDRDMVNRDQLIAMEKEANRRAMMAAQKGDMAGVQQHQMEEKRLREEMEKQGFREPQGTNPALLGNGYR